MPQTTSPTILLADDDDAVRRLLASFLELEGFAVTVAEDGASTLAALRERGEGIGVAVVDMMMPGMTCPELVREIRGLAPELPVLIVTGNTEAPDLLPLDSDARLGLLVKPFQPPELAARVRRFLGHG